MTARSERWLAEPVSPEVEAALARLCAADDVQQVAVMPDVHLASDVCVGVALATTRLVYPAAVGGDIGCGVAALGFDLEAGALRVATAARLFEALGRAVPTRRHPRQGPDALPADVMAAPLSHPRLEALRRRDGAQEFATLGSGNHFVELQSDDEGRLWLMLHSGSRVMGQRIRDHHVAPGLVALEGDAATAYVNDATWAVAYAAASRRAMVERVAEVVTRTLGGTAEAASFIDCDHNHVRAEDPGWVHRKGAMCARAGDLGVIPGSMGSWSFHVEGRGLPAALASSSHGAGRALSRGDARRLIAPAELRRQMRGVFFDPRLERALCDEAPGAYKDITQVMRAQRDLVRIVRRLRPLLCYKGPG